MSGDGVELQRMTSKDVYVPNFVGDKGSLELAIETKDMDIDPIYRPRGKPREFRCGEGMWLRVELNPCVFLFSTVIIWAFIIWGVADTDSFSDEFTNMKGNITEYWSWLYVGSLNIFMIFCFYLIFSKYGDILLAPEDDPAPRFNYFTWFSMLFSAGVGIGLFFFGVSEPSWFVFTLTRENVNFIRTSIPTPDGDTRGLNKNDWANPESVFTPDSRYERVLQGMNIAWFHWGLSASSCYIVFGLPLAFYHYRYGMPLSVRSAFFPLIGNRIYGWFGDLVDAFCVIGTVFGVCTSLGLGVSQMVTGMNVYNEDVVMSYENQVWTIVGITAVATISVVTGLDVGIRRLSEVNFTLGLLLLFMLFYMISPEYFLDLFVSMIGYHVQQLPHTSTATEALERHVALHPESEISSEGAWQGYMPGSSGFMDAWTVFYWGWWISWSPFVGTFLARISKGRTVREFIVGNMIVPTILTSIWFTIFAGTSFIMQFNASNNYLDCCSIAPTTDLTCMDPMLDSSDGNVYGIDYNSKVSDTYDSCLDKFRYDPNPKLVTCVDTYDEEEKIQGNMGQGQHNNYEWDIKVCNETTVTHSAWQSKTSQHVTCEMQFAKWVHHRRSIQYDKSKKTSTLGVDGHLDTCIGPYHPCMSNKLQAIGCRIGAAQPQNTPPLCVGDKYPSDPTPEEVKEITDAGKCVQETNRLGEHLYWKASISSFGSSQKMLYDVLQYAYLSDFTMVVAIAGLFTYFITSSDSASQVCDMISSNGDLEPPYWQRVYWAITEGLLAIVLVGSGKEKVANEDYHTTSSASLAAIQAASIVAGFPLCWIMLMLIVATWRSLNVELKIINGEPLPPKKDYKIPCVDAFVQVIGKCMCGLGAIWMTKEVDPMECVRACVSCFCPCLAMMRVVQQTSTSMAGKAVWAFCILAPYICLIVWFAMCPQYIEWFDTKAMDLDGESHFNADDCEDQGYVGLFGATWLMIVLVSVVYRSQQRERHGITGNACNDCIIFFAFPSVAAYQSLQQWRLSRNAESTVQDDWADDKGKGGVQASTGDEPVGTI